MLLLTTTEVGQLLGVSAATIKRLSVAGKIRCARSGNGTREFSLDDLASYLGADTAGTLDAAVRARAADRCIAVLVRACASGLPLARAFDELLLPALSRWAWEDLSFVSRCEPLGFERHPRTSQPTAIVLSAAMGTARPALATCLLRSLGYRVPSLSREADREVLRVVTSADPSLVLAVAPHRPDLDSLRAALPPVLARLGGRLLIDGAGDDFRSFEELHDRCRIRPSAQRVAEESVAVS